MKDHKLEDYVKVYRGAIDKDTCDFTVDILKQKEFKLHEFYDESQNRFFSHEKELSSCYDTDLMTQQAIMGYTWNSIKRYTSEMNYQWWNTWQGYTPPKYNKYEPGTVMEFHCDHIKSIFDGERKGAPILSVLTLLNDDFTGGELILFPDNEYKLNKGDTIVFPSNFMFPHGVNEVTSGVRYSCVSWVW